ncbi:MAG: hypothetical protein AAFV53_00340 [Myxococcota bacterium]
MIKPDLSIRFTREIKRLERAYDDLLEKYRALSGRQGRIEAQMEAVQNRLPEQPPSASPAQWLERLHDAVGDSMDDFDPLAFMKGLRGRDWARPSKLLEVSRSFRSAQTYRMQHIRHPRIRRRSGAQGDVLNVGDHCLVGRNLTIETIAYSVALEGVEQTMETYGVDEGEMDAALRFICDQWVSSRRGEE